ncbi:MAG: hypothetical protein ACYS8W_08630 [Planctomycetota bacterium]
MCNGCHRKRNPGYPAAPTWLYCEDCHATIQEDPLIIGNDLKLFIKTSLSGGSYGKDTVGEFLRENFDASGFVQSEDNETEIKLFVDCKLEEVRDRLIPPGSGAKLFRGRCVVIVICEGDEIFRRPIKSKVFVEKDAGAAQKSVLDYLGRAAFKHAKLVIEPFADTE